jgi:hypothetical protein
VDAARIRRQVAKIEQRLKAAEAHPCANTLKALHKALHIGVTVLEDETGETLLQGSTPPAGQVSTFSGGSGKDRPDVSGE